MTRPPLNNDWTPETDDLDELQDQGTDEHTMPDEGDDYGFDDSWSQGPEHIPDIHLKSLDEVIAIGYPGDPHDKTRTGGVVCPKALDLAWRMIKRKGRGWTKARIQRMSVYHGLRIIYMDEEVKATTMAYNKLMKISQGIDDDDLINTLAERKTFSFRDPTPKTTSMGTLVFLEGAIADLADCLGIAKSNMYPLLSLVSIVTYQPKLWEINLGKEYRSFRNAIQERHMKLEREFERIMKTQNKQQDGKTNKQKDV